MRLIDVRNNFEIDIGSFKRSERPMTKSFREFPNSIKKLKIRKIIELQCIALEALDVKRHQHSCERKEAKNVAILNGGIINT